MADRYIAKVERRIAEHLALAESLTSVGRDATAVMELVWIMEHDLEVMREYRATLLDGSGGACSPAKP